MGLDPNYTGFATDIYPCARYCLGDVGIGWWPFPDDVPNADVTNEQERIAMAMEESLAAFARLREQMRKNGPQAVVASLNSMSESDIQQVLFALVVTTERAEEER